jgi:hypothetical protein
LHQHFSNGVFLCGCGFQPRLSRQDAAPTENKYKSTQLHWNPWIAYAISPVVVYSPAARFEPRGLLVAAGRGVFVRLLPEQVRGDGQGVGAGGASVNTPLRTVAVSWRGGSPRCCCGCRARCCCAWPTGSSGLRCSSCRRGSRGWSLVCPWPFKIVDLKIPLSLFFKVSNGRYKR